MPKIDSNEDKIELERYEKEGEKSPYLEDVSQLSPIDRERMVGVGVDVTSKERSGTFIQTDHSVVHSSSLYEGLEVMDIDEALNKYDWIRDNYWWKAVSPDQDEYTRQVKANPHHGYFIRALPGVKVTYPLQACLFLKKNKLMQSVHNVIIAEPDSELNIITGCATASYVEEGIHLAVSEIYVRKGAKLSSTMIHSWGEQVVVRPRSVTIVEEDGTFLSNYIGLKPVRSLQMYPTTKLVGRGGLARYTSILYALPGSSMDIGSRVVLQAEDTKAEVISRAISEGGEIIARGHLVGEVAGVKAHLDCGGMILSDKGVIRAIPELEGRVPDVELSHEAAIGKVAREEIEYLMARGLSEEEATSTIVRGFLDTSIMGLPPQLQAEVDRAMEAVEKAY